MDNQRTGMRRSFIHLPAAAALALLACNPAAQGQSADALIQKLLEKGILTEQEARQLKTETDSGVRKAAQSALPSWVSSMKLGGDFRARYELFDSDVEGFADRHRFRYRLRLGLTALLKDHFEVGLRLASGEMTSAGGTLFGGDPISTNTSFQDNGSKKFIFVDLAYAKWSKAFGEGKVALAVGKMENPLQLPDLVFDADYTPEGFGERLEYAFHENHTAQLNLGQFLLDELGGDGNDPYLLGVQARVDSKWHPRIATSLGISALTIQNEEVLTSTAVPNVNRGNTRTAGGVLVEDFNPWVADSSFTYTFDRFPGYPGSFPIRLGADYVQNPGADDHNQGFQAGLIFGKAGKKGAWELSYRYRHMESDAWYEELVDSDFGAVYGAPAPAGGATGYGPGTNVKGHLVKFSYSPYDSLTLSIAGIFTDLIRETPRGGQNETTRIQLDAVWKF